MAQTNLRLDARYLEPEASREEVLKWQEDVTLADERLLSGKGRGAAFRGWLDPCALAPDSLLDEICEAADALRSNSGALVVIGIGGSYLGARAVIEALAPDSAQRVYFAGNSISGDYHARLLAKLQSERFALNVISKSGTTTEPAIAFRIFRQRLEASVGREGAAKLIAATTDANRGALLKLARDEGYRRFVVPDDVGGRFSVLSPVGLLPIAYAGVDIRALVRGAAACAAACANRSLDANPALYYAAARNTLYSRGFTVEMLAHFEPRLAFVAEWWKQLFGESEGKEGKGLFPASLNLTADLHSMGQYAQQGRRMLMETFVVVEGGEEGITIPANGGLRDGLEYLAGRTLASVNHEAYRATALAHREGGVPNMTIRLPRLDEENLGALLYFFERACAVSGYLLRVNPFNQPGVEAYKKHMFALLGRPGHEEQTQAIREKVEDGPSGCEITFA